MRSDDHLSETTLAAAAEGNLRPWERRRVLRHLAACSECAGEFTELHALLKAANLLLPVILRHPLEEWLAWLGALVRLPPWAWHFILFGLTPLFWITLADVSAIPYLQTARQTLEPRLVSLVMTTHFVWLQSQLRRLLLSLWQAGVPADEIDTFQRRYLLIFQGRPLGGAWSFLGAAVLATLTNRLLIPGQAPWERIKVEVVGVYALTITLAMYWGWLSGGRLLWGLSRLWQRHPMLREQPVTKWVQRLAAGWVALSAGGMAWHLALAVGVAEIRLAMQVWGIVIFLMLLSLWSGYAVLEWRLARRPARLRWTWQPAMRLVVTLALVVLILPIVNR